MKETDHDKVRNQNISGQAPYARSDFEDKSFDLLGEFLTAEKSFRREILSTVNEVDLDMSGSDSFTGNAFTLDVNKDVCKITNDIDDRELEVPTEDFKKILLEYIYALREINVKEKMAKLGHHHDHEHHHH